MVIQDIFSNLDSTYWDELLLTLAGLCAGIINTVSGSGTMFTLGVMSLMGIPLNIANIATRPGVLVQNVTSLAVLHKYGQIDRKVLYRNPILYVALGSLLGAVLATIISSKAFDLIASVVMLILLLKYFIPARWLALDGSRANSLVWHSILFFVAGIYGGFIQIGVGIVLLTLLIGYRGLEYVSANILKLVIVLIYTVPTVLYFIWTDTILWKPALLLALGQLIGAWLAAVFLSKNSNAAFWAKWVTITMIVVTLIKIWVW